MYICEYTRRRTSSTFSTSRSLVTRDRPALEQFSVFLSLHSEGDVDPSAFDRLTFSRGGAPRPLSFSSFAPLSSSSHRHTSRTDTATAMVRCWVNPLDNSHISQRTTLMTHQLTATTTSKKHKSLSCDATRCETARKIAEHSRGRLTRPRSTMFGKVRVVRFVPPIARDYEAEMGHCNREDFGLIVSH